jgi:hypothetical protein
VETIRAPPASRALPLLIAIRWRGCVPPAPITRAVLVWMFAVEVLLISRCKKWLKVHSDSFRTASVLL